MHALSTQISSSTLHLRETSIRLESPISSQATHQASCVVLAEMDLSLTETLVCLRVHLEHLNSHTRMEESLVSELLSHLHRLAQHQPLLNLTPIRLHPKLKLVHPKPKQLHLKLKRLYPAPNLHPELKLPAHKQYLNRFNKALLKLQVDQYLDLLHQGALKYRQALLPDALKTLSSMDTNVSVRSDSALSTVTACLFLFLNRSQLSLIWVSQQLPHQPPLHLLRPLLHLPLHQLVKKALFQQLQPHHLQDQRQLLSLRTPFPSRQPLLLAPRTLTTMV